MIIFSNNRKFTFDILLDKQNNIKINDSKIKYDDYFNFLKNSLENYTSIDEEKIVDSFENYFTYFKITTNPLVRENMTSKILYLLVNSYSLDINIFKNKKINDLIDSHIYSNDKYFKYIKITMKLKLIESTNKKINIEFDTDNFNILDFILDYYD